jgi:4-alpha-glucanotransferase
MPVDTTPQGPLTRRRAGVLLHVTSLPSPYGRGDVGPAARAFVDFLADAGCTVWQVLPLVPTHRVDRSPYNAMSALALNPELISVDDLATQGLLAPEDAEAVARGRLSPAAARDLVAARWPELCSADPHLAADFARWCEEHGGWLDDYVRFVALRESRDEPWTDWPVGLRDHDPSALEEALTPLAEQVEALRALQYLVDRQWAALREYAGARGVVVFGDLPIFVSLDSADVWADRDMFRLDPAGRPVDVTGVPPDYFAADGQRWNNPHYDWERMAADDFGWWRRRIGRQRQLFDIVRIDHFRGFEAAWHIPADAPTAKEGHWEKSPGREVLTALVETAGEGTLVAEDLGTITPEVLDLRDEFGLPGMKVLQFAFDGDPDNWYLPSAHGTRSVVYTGTHDNDTTLGWWSSLEEDDRDRVRTYLDDPDEDMPWALVRLALASTSVLAVVPAQDLLGLGSEARMNTPGVEDGNWGWQAEDGAFTAALAARLRAAVEASERR